MTGETQLYVCADCGRVGPLPEGFSDDCRPGWTHGRLIKITSDPERDQLAQEVRDLHADAVREHVGETVLAERDQLREEVADLLHALNLTNDNGAAKQRAVVTEHARYRVALNEIATAPLVDINADGADQASEAMQVIARVALGGVYA